MCGEKYCCVQKLYTPLGSPPRVRGKGWMLLWSDYDVEDHPRVCGEKSHHYADKETFRGSPPRVRGKVFLLNAMHSPCGITPACAGKRKYGYKCCNNGEDHPRVCGEKKARDRKRILESGSPPRVRGKDNGDCVEVLRDRITPACAGKRKGKARWI